MLTEPETDTVAGRENALTMLTEPEADTGEDCGQPSRSELQRCNLIQQAPPGPATAPMNDHSIEPDMADWMYEAARDDYAADVHAEAEAIRSVAGRTAGLRAFGWAPAPDPASSTWLGSLPLASVAPGEVLDAVERVDVIPGLRHKHAAAVAALREVAAIPAIRTEAAAVLEDYAALLVAIEAAREPRPHAAAQLSDSEWDLRYGEESARRADIEDDVLGAALLDLEERVAQLLEVAAQARAAGDDETAEALEAAATAVTRFTGKVRRALGIEPRHAPTPRRRPRCPLRGAPAETTAAPGAPHGPPSSAIDAPVATAHPRQPV